MLGTADNLVVEHEAFSKETISTKARLAEARDLIQFAIEVKVFLFAVEA